MPRRSPGRMGQRNKIEDVFGATSAKLAADHLLQFRALDELPDCQSPDRNNQTRLKNFDLFVHPGGAIENFVWRRHAVGAAGRFSRETSTYRRKINFGSHGGFVHPAKFLEPAEKCLPSRMCEWAFQSGLARTGRLSNQHHLADNRATGHWRRFHSRTTPASNQPRNMSI